MYVSQIIMLYTLNLYSAACQLYPDKTGRKAKPKQKIGKSKRKNKRFIFMGYLIRIKFIEFIINDKEPVRTDLQDGRGVRHGDHLPRHKYIKNTSTCATTPTEHLLNTGRRLQTSPKARNSSCTWVGQKKKEKTQTKE